MRKKILSLIFLGFLILSCSPLSSVSAQLVRPASPVSLLSIIFNVANAVWIIFTLVVVVAFVAAGIIFLTAQGSPEKIKTAKAAFLWGVAGVAVGIIAFSIKTIVERIMTTGV